MLFLSLQIHTEQFNIVNCLVSYTKTAVCAKTTSTCLICSGRRRWDNWQLVCVTYSMGTLQHAMPVSDFMDRVSNSDEHIEGSLSTVFQNVRGSNYFCYLRRSDVLCMVREYGPPTLFLTLSCAEYDSLEIATYLRKQKGE